MARSIPPLFPRHLSFVRALAGVLLLLFPAFCPPVSAKPRSSPSPSATPRPLTPDKIGADRGTAADALPDPVARVNGQPISRADLLRVTESLLAANGRKLATLSDAEKKVSYVSVLDQIITDRLITAEAKNEKVDDLQVETTYGNLQKQYPDAAVFDAEVKKSGQTPDKIRTNIRGQLAQQQWLEKQIAADSKVSPQEVEKFYKDGPPEKFAVPEMVSARHILVAVSRSAPPEDALDAENKLKALGDRIRKGEKFEDLARDQSDDPNTKKVGGDLGYFSRDRVLPEIGEAAFQLKAGEVSAPVRTDFGYHLIKLTDRKPPHAATLDEVREQVTTFMIEGKREAAIRKVVQSLRDNAKIENFLS